MHKAALFLLGAVALTACDNRAPERVNPSLASLSNIFGFDPLLGKVRAFSQIQKDESGKITADIRGTLDEQGCVQALRAFQPQMDVDVDLVKEGDYFVDRASHKKLYQLDAHCRLERTIDGSLLYRKDAKGFVTEVVKTANDDSFAHYSYDELGFPRTTLFQSPLGKTEIEVKDDAPAHKRLDATTEAKVDGKPAGINKMSCRYDEHANPLSCSATITAEGDYGSAGLSYNQTYQTSYY
ncbi:YnfC family lipoprotein [Nissabacter sp. SGAir0207]|uniref:YnfC family lipoprotein n=1 Tax=Nissabacter sp. SGAir0207 TaxID=2126321 RepID=UPI0010CCF625|nr:YnfC family lipoprotein [Nissabacter sp. SGAir0207]QCR38511.1 YnfC family lipoprotein [Nissabacter sp. SGAir0207]